MLLAAGTHKLEVGFGGLGFRMFRAEDLGLRVWGFRIWGLGRFRVEDFGCRVWGSGFRV